MALLSPNGEGKWRVPDSQDIPLSTRESVEREIIRTLCRGREIQAFSPNLGTEVEFQSQHKSVPFKESSPVKPVLKTVSLTGSFWTAFPIKVPVLTPAKRRQDEKFS